MQQPNEVFERARQAREEGRFQEALKDHLWLHEHALDVSPDWNGVRLSFALRDWIYLAEQFPPARTALQAIRDRESARMLQGGATVERFREIASINEALGEVPATHQLFLALDSIDAAVAEQCAELAMNALVKCQDFQLARRFLASPEQRIAQLAERLNGAAEALASQPASAAPTLLAFVLNYAKEVRLVLAVLRGMDEHDEAGNMKKAALDAIRSDGLRAIMQRELDNPGSTLAAMAKQQEQDQEQEQ
jgi:hypothetical protein